MDDGRNRGARRSLYFPASLYNRRGSRDARDHVANREHFVCFGDVVKTYAVLFYHTTVDRGVWKSTENIAIFSRLCRRGREHGFVGA